MTLLSLRRRPISAWHSPCDHQQHDQVAVGHSVRAARGVAEIAHTRAEYW